MNHDKLRKLALNATPGLWVTAPPLIQDGGMFFGTAAEEDPTKTDLLLGSATYARDGEFIAAANPLAVLALLDELQRLKAERALIWEQGANAAWEKSDNDVNGETYFWRHEGVPFNPYRGDAP